MADSDVTEINVPFPETADRRLRISVGACRLRIRPGGDTPWVAGTYRDPSRALPCRIISEEGTVRITQGQHPGEFLGLLSGAPVFDLTLGRAAPYELTLETGATEAEIDLGGLPITRLVVKHGAGKTDLDFSIPNPQPMSLLEISAGATAMDVSNLANANAAELLVEGGAASYRLHFGGVLQRNAHARVSTGVASVTIEVPTTTAAKIRSESTLGSVDVGDGFMRKEGAFWNRGALEGNTPALIVQASVALGSLRLRTFEPTRLSSERKS